MSWQAYAAVSGKRIGSGTGKLVLLELANHANADGTAAYPSKPTMAETAECDVKTVQRHLRKLEAAGWIRRGDQELVSHYRADRRPIVYDVAMDDSIRAAWALAYAASNGFTTPHDEPETTPDGAPDAGEQDGRDEGASGGTGTPPTIDGDWTDCPPAERDDRTDCPPVPDATGGHPSASRGDAAVSPKYPITPITPQPPSPPAPSELLPRCPDHDTTTTGCQPCRTAKRLAGKAAAAALESSAERAARHAADKARRVRAAADRTAADEARLLLERRRAAEADELAARKAAVRAGVDEARRVRAAAAGPGR